MLTSGDALLQTPLGGGVTESDGESGDSYSYQNLNYGIAVLIIIQEFFYALHLKLTARQTIYVLQIGLGAHPVSTGYDDVGVTSTIC